ncbi:gliding motility-associated-like protein [Flavobacterium sp. CG_23.5]|uniref:T9SS type B sorting domain-containing protein n=1 Tax=Flavobacterium sp. CG_23.5 TaxID=2760708 RepID=UPI001AEA35F4|nr:T9SS type B sorting domain-containing protein [Flavobacterium sp. CG_23.5]MBP2284455.1 gliding motility-associated-like protein [Flavobacterium sp. CG_23.5]
MEKSTKLLIFMYLLINVNLFAREVSNKVEIKIETTTVATNLNNSKFTPAIDITSSILRNLNKSSEFFNIATPPPTVTSPIYYCQNKVANPLTATPSAGGTLNWYGTNAIGGTASSTAPTPSTTAIGTTSYYVSETVSGVESTRSKIDVIIVADNGSKILLLRCDPTQIAAADKNSSVFFDWTNTTGLPNQYSYSYTIDGGPPVTESTGLSNLQVFGLLPGQSVTLTVAHTTYPCDLSVFTCTVPCGTSTTTPNFAQIPPFCSGDTAPLLGNTSPNGITGTWAPAIINNTTSGSNLFTPNSTLFPCATTQTLAVTITPKATPNFTTIPATVCQNATAPVLPLNSNNTPAISGTWSPSTVNTSILGAVTYTFTPNSGQCVVGPATTKTITIEPNIAPNFANIAPICSGNPAPVFGTTSPNGINGTWSPATINTTASGSYIFSPAAGQCATKQTLNVTITPKTVPNFPAIASFCEGSSAPILDNNVASPNGVSGTWSPATINNTASGNYVFTPNANQCATTQTLIVTVNPRVSHAFSSFAICAGSVPPVLPLTSPNGVKGTWSPAVIDNMNNGSYIFTPDANQCAISKTISVTVTPSNTLVKVEWTVTQAFAENQVVTITATAPGDYLYQLDDGPFQESPVFEYVSYGTHAITVKDKFGCNAPITKSNVLVINYPKYFTPNNDGINDNWNIFSLDYLSNSRIFIFDRYGKLLKEISTKSLGWDGMYNGHAMPSNDYWFSVEYVENDISKIFKSHFSLKR